MKKITLLLALLACAFANAQWVTDTAVNTLVADSASDDAKSIGTSDGKTFVVFWKSVAAPTNYELRVQLLDAAGVQQFGTDGMLVSNTVPMSTFTYVWKLTIDKDDNLYVCVTGSGAGNPGYIFKIDTAGNSAWENGLNLGAGLVPTVLPLQNGDVIVSYWPGSGKAKMQRFTAAGTPVWANPTDITGASITSATIPADLYELSGGDYTVVFHQKFNFGISSNLYFQKYSQANGIQTWEVPTQVSDKGTVYNATYSGAQDGDVIYYGYSGATGLRYDGYVQRINPDGTTPWGINGMDFDTNTTNYETDTKIAFAPGSDYVWAIARYTPSTQDVYGEYVQKFDKVTGARQFTDNAKEVFEIDADSRNHIGDLFLQDDEPLFLIKTGMDNGVSPVTLSGVLLDENGNATGETPIPVATFAASKGRVTLNKPVNGQTVAVFTEQKQPGETKIYAQHFATAVLANETFDSVAGIRVYPNPASGIFTVDGSAGIESVAIFNATGQLIHEDKAAVAGIRIDSGNWSNGIYMINITTKDGSRNSVKLVKAN